MSDASINVWLAGLGYADDPDALHCDVSEIPDAHPYSPEISALLNPEGAIRARAVYDVEGVPSVIFLGDQDNAISEQELDVIRQKIWNQNLANVVLEINGDTARAHPARKLKNNWQPLNLADARSDGPFSAREVSSANLARRLPEWFDVKARVDSKLLENITAAVREISLKGYAAGGNGEDARRLAELLMGQVLFISYLEHRQIVGATYREHHGLQQLHGLVADKDKDGLRRLIDCLRQDFNGDFLGDDRHDPWLSLDENGFGTLDRFLKRTDLQTGQGDFWNYDFSFIPVELLSGLYESFLSPEEKASSGAYYTPRHLAMLAIDQAFESSADPLAETIFDGACGSGILLTTAYRRLIALKEARSGRRLTFKARRDLLVSRIFGADINPMACRVTAFSLYLSLLEGLDPSDILEAQAQENVQLPTLEGTNLVSGLRGDFFASDHGFAGKQFTLLISNPPWRQADGKSITSADRWTEEQGAAVALRQIAGAFSLRAMDFLIDSGRVCLILPITLFVGPTNAKFVAQLFGAVQPIRLINFGDLQNLLFPSAEHTCHLFVGHKRAEYKNGDVPSGETFDYCVPKADMSLAFGRLTLASADRHRLQTANVVHSPQLLVTLMWGDNADLALITRLEAYGTLGDFWRNTGGITRWSARKGLHVIDKSRAAVSAEPLKTMGFVPVPALRLGVPVLHHDLLTPWPPEQDKVALLDEDLLQHFKGPRVLFSDGFSSEDLALRAVYFEEPGSFTKSIGVISGPDADSDLLKFLSAYLRSNLGRYFLMMRAWKMLCERNAVHLGDVATFPFFTADKGPAPDKSMAALRAVADRMTALMRTHEWQQAAAYANMKADIDEHVFDYFDIAPQERALICETVNILMPSIRPRGYVGLNTPIQRIAGADDVEEYAQALSHELTNWRRRTQGKGQFDVRVVASDPSRPGGSGVVHILFNHETTAEGQSSSRSDSNAVLETFAELRRQGLAVVPAGRTLWLVPDTFIWADGTIFIVRSLVRRNWTIRQALRDAEHIVRHVQDGQSRNSELVAA